VAEGSVGDVMAAQDSQTGRYLLHAMRHPLQARRVDAALAAGAGAQGRPLNGSPSKVPICTTCRTLPRRCRSSGWWPLPA
jgi:excinuclease ABC subunit A